MHGLRYLHAKGIMHRDLKLENIMVVPNTLGFDGWTVKIIDLGLSCLSLKGVKATGQCGTLAYNSPEILQAGKPYDNSNDVWSLGVILHALLTRQFPFISKNLKDTKQNIIE